MSDIAVNCVSWPFGGGTNTTSSTPLTTMTPVPKKTVTSYSYSESINESSETDSRRKNLTFKGAASIVRSKIRSQNTGMEYYPELTGTLINFIETHDKGLKANDQDALFQLQQLTKKILIHLPKFSALEVIIEAHGWNGAEYITSVSGDINFHGTDFTALSAALSRLYYAHYFGAAAPSKRQQQDNAPSSTSKGKHITHVNIFHEDRLIGSFCPNILYTLLSIKPEPLEELCGSAVVYISPSHSASHSLKSPFNYSMSPVLSLNENRSIMDLARNLSPNLNTNSSFTLFNNNPNPKQLSFMKHKDENSATNGSQIVRMSTSTSSRVPPISGSGSTHLSGQYTRLLSFYGACILADISGFTKLSSKLCDRGLDGLDDLHNAASGFLGKYVQIVYSYRGDGKCII